MNEKEFVDWCKQEGYRLDNDWNWQLVDGIPHYWIKNHKTNLYALIKEYDNYFIVLVKDFNTFGCLDE